MTAQFVPPSDADNCAPSHSPETVVQVDAPGSWGAPLEQQPQSPGSLSDTGGHFLEPGRRRIIANSQFSQSELQMMTNGANSVVSAAAVALGAVYVFLYLVVGNSSVLLFTLSIIPVATIVSVVKICYYKTIALALMVEMILGGAVLSILAATILEAFSEFETPEVWDCQANVPSINCSIRFLILIIVSVGFVEELSKIFPLSRIKTQIEDLPSPHAFWFRIVRTPEGFALSGLCSGAGFAAVENVKYVFSSGGGAVSIGTSMWRAVLSIPFHLACTTYASSELAKFLFPKALSSTIDTAAHRAGLDSVVPLVGDGSDVSSDGPAVGSPGYHEVINGSQSDRMAVEPAAAQLLTGVETGASFPQRIVARPRLRLTDILLCLLVPSLMHGLYDSGLFLAVQSLRQGTPYPQSCEPTASPLLLAPSRQQAPALFPKFAHVALENSTTSPAEIISVDQPLQRAVQGSGTSHPDLDVPKLQIGNTSVAHNRVDFTTSDAFRREFFRVGLAPFRLWRQHKPSSHQNDANAVTSRAIAPQGLVDLGPCESSNDSSNLAGEPTAVVLAYIGMAFTCYLAMIGFCLHSWNSLRHYGRTTVAA